jgi:hypothetical protein
MWNGMTNRASRLSIRNLIFLLLILAGSVGAIGAIATGYSGRMKGLSGQIVLRAEQLRNATDGPTYDFREAEEILSELKGLIKQYEDAMVFAQSPYPGEILLGTTPAGDSTWLETLCTTRYEGPLKEIRIRRTGGKADYLRINDIEITYSTPAGLAKETFNQNGRVKLYQGGVFALALPRPMNVRRIRININHESTGLEVYGVPYALSAANPAAEEDLYPGEALLGTTPPGDSTWLETLCSSPHNRPIREIRLRRTGREASYIRINDIEVTHLTPEGMKKELFNIDGRLKLYYDGVCRIPLPRPMRIVHIRILIDHESAGLKVYGLY